MSGDPMADLRRAVDGIIETSHDPERAHADEDALLRYLIRQHCPDWVVAEVERLAAADFPRWAA